MEKTSYPSVLANKGAEDGNMHGECSLQGLATNVDDDDAGHRETMKLLFQLHCLPVKVTGTAANFPGRTGAPVPGSGYALCQVCKEPEGSRQALLCDICHSSYHVTCINSQAEQASKLDEWFCKACSIQGVKQMWPLGKVDLNLRICGSRTHQGETALPCRIPEQEKANLKILGEDVLQIEERELNGRRGRHTDNNNSSRHRISLQLSPDGPDNNCVESSEHSQTQKTSRQENEMKDVSCPQREVEENKNCLDKNLSASDRNSSPERLLKCGDEDLEQLKSYGAAKDGTREDAWMADTTESKEGTDTTTSTHYYSPAKKPFKARKQVARHLGLVETGDEGASGSTCETESRDLESKFHANAAPGQDGERTSPVVNTAFAGSSGDCPAKSGTGEHAPASIDGKAEGPSSKSSMVRTSRARGGAALPSMCTAGEFEQQERFRRLEVAAVEQLQKYVADRNGVLEGEWKADVTKRKKGKGSTVRTHYVSPEGRIFKSRVQVADYLGLSKMVDNGYENVEAGSTQCTEPSAAEMVKGAAQAGEAMLQSSPASSRVPKPNQVVEEQPIRFAQPQNAETSQTKDGLVAMPELEPQALAGGPIRAQAPRILARSGRGPMQLLRQYIAEMNGDLGDGWTAEVSTRKKYGKDAKETKYFSPENKIFRSRVQIARHLGLLDSMKGRSSGAGDKERKELSDETSNDSASKKVDKGENSQSTRIGGDRCEVNESHCDILTEDDILRNIREFVAEQNILIKEQLQQDTDIDDFVRRKRPRVRLCLNIARQLGASGLKSLDIRGLEKGRDV